MQKHNHWLEIAQEDLNSAKHLHAASYTTALFHAQQCAEKSLKAYLVLSVGMALKTHDLVRLVDMCMELDERFETLRLFAAVLTPYERAGRYPDVSFARPTFQEIEMVIDQAAYVFDFVICQVEKV